MVFLENLPENVNITVTKKDLFEIIDYCLSKNLNKQAIEVPEHLTIKKLAEYLSYSPPAIYKMVGQAEIPSYKLSGKLLFKKSEIDDWLLDFRQPTIKARIAELDSKCK
jgi:excisionase family DNA binding protein